jgi:imidazoleglycerol-phosphate dehydratase / histidinol-phosphatase
MKKVLFIDRDGTLILEPPVDYQVDSFEKLAFFPGVFEGLGKIAAELDFELVMVTNQDGLGTDAFPYETFKGPHELMVKTLASEGIVFAEECIDRSFPHEQAETRKPRTGLLTKYFNGEYDLANSFVIGDRLTDVELAKNLGSKAIFIQNEAQLGNDELSVSQGELEDVIALKTNSWKEIFTFLRLGQRRVTYTRNTNETKIDIELDLDGTGKSNIHTGISFFDHMLDQIAKHGQLDLKIEVKGDLEVDEHHTIEDTAIALGECFSKALGNKLGIERYGFYLPRWTIAWHK